MRRLGRLLFWGGLPLAAAALVQAPKWLLIEIDGLPHAAADVFLFFPATLLALGTLAVAVGRHRRRARPCAPPYWGAAVLIPILLAGLESVRFVMWTIRCGMNAPLDSRGYLLLHMALNLGMFVVTVAAAALSAKVVGFRGPLASRLTWASAATMASVALTWGVILLPYWIW